MNADIVFVLDISNSINDSELRAALDFEAKYVQNLTIGPDDDQVATLQNFTVDNKLP